MDKAPPSPDERSPADLPRLALPVGQLLSRRRTQLRFAPTAEERAAIAAALDLIELPEMRFEGEVEPQGRDLALTARLTARAVQACVVTLAPVPAKVDQEIRRRFLADWQEPEGDEAEIPEDDTIEPLPGVIDVAGLAIEALALALPEYPRAAGAELGAAEYPPPGAEAAEEPKKPLADLAALLARKAQES